MGDEKLIIMNKFIHHEGAERSGVHDEEQWTKDRALGDTAGGCVPGRQVGYTFDTEGTR